MGYGFPRPQRSPCVVVDAPAEGAVPTNNLFGRPQVVIDDICKVTVLQPHKGAKAVRLEEPVNGLGLSPMLGHLTRNHITIPDEGDLPVIPELAEELERLPSEQQIFLAKDDLREPYKVTSFGNWFRDRCCEAGVPGSIHGLRKAGATRLADAGASDLEIASYLAHTDTTQASVYTRRANRSKLADSGFKKLEKLSNSSGKLDRKED